MSPARATHGRAITPRPVTISTAEPSADRFIASNWTYPADASTWLVSSSGFDVEILRLVAGFPFDVAAHARLLVGGRGLAGQQRVQGGAQVRPGRHPSGVRTR